MSSVSIQCRQRLGPPFPTCIPCHYRQTRDRSSPVNLPYQSIQKLNPPSPTLLSSQPRITMDPPYPIFLPSPVFLPNTVKPGSTISHISSLATHSNPGSIGHQQRLLTYVVLDSFAIHDLQIVPSYIFKSNRPTSNKDIGFLETLSIAIVTLLGPHPPGK